MNTKVIYKRLDHSGIASKYRPLLRNPDINFWVKPGKGCLWAWLSGETGSDSAFFSLRQRAARPEWSARQVRACKSNNRSTFVGVTRSTVSVRLNSTSCRWGGACRSRCGTPWGRDPRRSQTTEGTEARILWKSGNYVKFQKLQSQNWRGLCIRFLQRRWGTSGPALASRFTAVRVTTVWSSPSRIGSRQTFSSW